MSIGHIRDIGGNKYNPKLIYENGTFTDGYMFTATLTYSSGYSLSDGKITNTTDGIVVNSPVYASCFKMVNVDLTKFIGKKLYVAHKLYNDVEYTEELEITSDAKSFVIGAYGGGSHPYSHYLYIALCNQYFESATTVSDKFVKEHHYLRSLDNSIVYMTTITKIWIA